MCGISITRRINAIDKIQHRGIESVQIAEGGWFLGHVRLPIQTEPGDRMAQPIELAGNNGWLLYVGEIYNYPTRYSSDVEYLRDLFGSSCLEDIIYEANNWEYAGTGRVKLLLSPTLSERSNSTTTNSGKSARR